jgi:DNA-binding MarR family transcriptional regulator
MSSDLRQGSMTAVEGQTAGTGPDQVDLVVAHWQTEDPDIDVAAKTAALRLRRAANHLQRELRRELLPLEMEMWEFEMLLALRRVPGQQLSAGALLRLCQVTSGAISNRLARLENRGWVRRDIDPRDRRQVLVTLTEDGVARAYQLLNSKTRAEQRLFSGIERSTLERLTADLRTLLVSLEGPADAADPFAVDRFLDLCPTDPPTSDGAGRASRGPGSVV